MIILMDVLNSGENRELQGKMNSLLIALFSLFVLFPSPFALLAQVSSGGLPLSFDQGLRGGIPEIKLAAPDFNALNNRDIEDEKQGLPRRVGIAVPAGIDVLKEAGKTVLPDGTTIWRLAITCENSLAMGLYFDDFQLAEGYRIFVYDVTYRDIKGSYTLLNNKPNRLFSTELVQGDRLIVEINADPGAEGQSYCRIADVSCLYRDCPEWLEKKGTADDCEVNINCPEGNSWQLQKHGVVRLYVRQSSGFFWCTGSLLNNTLEDNAPFLLTADHCAPEATAEDLAQWIFYFNYEAEACENPTAYPDPLSMTGGTRLAHANTIGSDFMLVRISDEIPSNYQPYFNGWSAENLGSPSGVTIHHPAGDLKKISTYTQPVQSSQWNGASGTHWMVYWSQTMTSWGVTEGGSSGAPLFDNSGLVIGALTGGQAACDPDGSGAGTGPDQPDFYGKFSYSWDQNGSEQDQQLKYWLDPVNSGVRRLNGKFAELTAAFQAGETLILAGSTVEFTNMSSGLPVLWEWTFEGGEPETWLGPEPVPVKYQHAGLFDVRLVVSDGTDYDTLLIRDLIQVVGKVYPNPTQGMVYLYIEEELPANIQVDVFNNLGQKIHQQNFPNQSYRLIPIDLSLYSSGIYTLRAEIKQRYVFARIMLKN